MTDTEQEPTVGLGTLELIGQLMAQSSRDLAWTNEQLQGYYQDRVREFAQAVSDLGRILETASVLDRESQWRFEELWVEVVMARDYLRRLEETS